jgi:hypothetical protein
MADKTDYEIFNIPLLARNIAASRLKRLYPSVPAEYAEMKSREVAMGVWSIDPTTHEPINDKGQTLIDDLEFTIAGPVPRSHWEIPELPVQEAEAIAAIWTMPNMTARSQRYQALLDYHKSAKLAGIAFAEEAARHNVKHPFSDEVGTKPGSEKKSDDVKSAGPPLSQNPWSPKYRGTPAEAEVEKDRLCRLGSALARNVARSAGVSIFGVPLK